MNLLCRVPVTVTTIYRDDNEVQAAKGGENLRLRLGGIDEDEVSPGFVLCSRHLPVPAVTYFDAQLHLLDLLEHKSLFSAGYKAILHIHACVEECEITKLLAQIDPKTKQKKQVSLHVGLPSTKLFVMWKHRWFCGHVMQMRAVSVSQFVSAQLQTECLQVPVLIVATSLQHAC